RPMRMEIDFSRIVLPQGPSTAEPQPITPPSTARPASPQMPELDADSLRNTRKSCAASSALDLRRPLHTRQLARQLLRVNRPKAFEVETLARPKLILRRANDQPEHFGVRIVENLPQHLRSDEHAAMLGHGERLLPDPNAPHTLDDKIKLLRQDMLMQRIRALGRETPKPGS